MAQMLPTSSQSLSPESAASIAPIEYSILLMGTWHKQTLFDQLQLVADKFEQHIQYADTCYLTFHFEQESVVLELIDPGMEHTGAREMAIRKADAAILCYAAYSPASFHTLATIADDFKCLEEGRQPACLLLCNEDQLIEHSEPEDGEKTDGSEGYGSASNSPPEEEMPPMASPRRHSMEGIRRERDEGQCPITRDQGEQLARQFGQNCEFRALSFSSAQQALRQMVDQLIRRAREQRKSRQSTRSRSNSRRLSPITILRRTSLKKLLTHSKSDAARKEPTGPAKRLSQPPQEMSGSMSSMDLTDGGKNERKRHSVFGNALRVLVHPRGRAKSQNKVTAANEGEIGQSKSTDGPGQSQTVQRTPFGLEVIPPTGDPCNEPFAFDPVRVNNFVGDERGEKDTQQNGKPKRGSLAEQAPAQKGGRLRTISSPPSSTACVIQ